MWWMRRASCSFYLLALLFIVPPAAVAAQRADVGALNEQSAKLHSQGKDKEATAIAEKAMALAERKLGPSHPGTLKSLINLASLYMAQGRYAEAEPLLKRALAGFERASGKDALATLSVVSSLGSLYQSQGRYAEAETFIKRALDGHERTRGPDAPQTLASAENLGSLYRIQGRYAEAEPLYKRALVGFERVLGPERPDTLGGVENLAQLYSAQGRHGEAEPLLKRALEADERLSGPDNPKTLRSLVALADAYEAQGKHSEAEPLLTRAVEASERVLGSDHPDTLARVNSLASIARAQGHNNEAETLYKRALAGSERALGRENPGTVALVENLAGLYQAMGRYGDAEPLLQRALDAYERASGPDHPNTVSVAGKLAALYEAQRRFGEAAPLYRRELETRERLLGPAHPDTLVSVVKLADLYKVEGRPDEAEPLYQRALEAFGRALGPERPETIASAAKLASLYREQGRYAEAEPLYKRILAANEHMLGADHPQTLDAAGALAALYQAMRRYDEAEPLYKRTLEAKERLLGPDNLETLSIVDNLAKLYSEQDRLGDAEKFQKRALEARERVLGHDHPETLGSVARLAELRVRESAWAAAVDLWRRSTSAIAARMLRGASDDGQAPTGKAGDEASEFRAFIKAAYRLTPQGGMPDADLSREMFQVAQWAKNAEAWPLLMRMAARVAAGNPTLAALAGERQDLAAERQRRERLQNAALGEAPEKRDAETKAENAARLAAIDARIQGIDKDLAENFPGYANLMNPVPVSVEEIQSLLGDDEALVLFLDTVELGPMPEESFVWVVTKTASRWVRSAMGAPTLTEEVAALRCGLDQTAWDGPRCGQLSGQSYTDADRKAGKPLPFDYARALRLYQALFGQVEDLIKGKRLLIAASGPLTQLPFQALITAASKNGEEPPAWLIRDHAISVLPAASSLKALRRSARQSAAEKPMIGFGNPLLEGPDGAYAQRAKEARDNRTCASLSTGEAASEPGAHSVAPVQMTRGLADVSSLRKQTPLPETADELCVLARDLHAEARDIYLGARASEHVVKRLSETGELAKYRSVHFATHARLAEQGGGIVEPGLIMTPPDTPNETDDGFLSASEIAALKLDADWVVLPAFNTAAEGAGAANALSGLARAFLAAQGKALLVSHWEVSPETTVKLITGAINRFAAEKSVGRAEAMRHSMLDLLDHGKPEEAHPSIWAPLTVVGE